MTIGLVASPAQRAAGQGPTVTIQTSGTGNRLISVSPVDERVVWASGAGGTYVVTTDGGQSWRAGVVPGADSLEFRDVEGVSDQVAYLLSIGPGESSRIYHTPDGGRTWSLQFQNHDPKAFYDCFDFWTPDRGITFSDASAGRFPAIRMTDGKSWQAIGRRLPAAQAGEGAFASSGTCVATQGQGNAWVGTGAAGKARVLRTTDGGDSWTSHGVPIRQGTPTSGVASVAFRDAVHGMLGGGDVADNLTHQKNAARSSDGGRSWSLTTPAPFTGAVFAVSYVPGRQLTVVATGPGGSAWSADEGKSWSLLPGLSGFWGAAFAGPRAGWLVGDGGRIVKVEF